MEKCNMERENIVSCEDGNDNNKTSDEYGNDKPEEDPCAMNVLELEVKSNESKDEEQVGVVENEEFSSKNISVDLSKEPEEGLILNNDIIGHLHQQNEAELENYLESLKPKPKRKSIKEMLLSMPGFDKLATVTPKLGGDEKQKVIYLDEEVDKKVKEKMSKHRQQIEDLKDRFVRHVITAPAKPVNEHIKLKITKKEEDSQGIEHLIENEVDYISSPMNENEEANILSTLSNTSPQSCAPMAQRRRLQDMLLKKIRAQKLKEHEEQCKALAMYDDEQDADDKEEFENEEVVDSESENESGVDEEEEEELEDLLSSSTKKKRKKSAFVDEEAEDEDASEVDNDTDDDDDDDENDNDDDESDEEVENCEAIEPTAEENDVSNTAISDDSLPAAQIATDDVDLDYDVASKSFETKEPEGSDFSIDVNTTPKLTNVVLNQRTPSDFWVTSKTNSGIRNDELSPLIPRINTSKNILKTCTVDISVLPTTLSDVISKPETKFDDLVDLCSGKFVSQANCEISETQENAEFNGFDFGDDEDLAEASENDGICKTPASPKTKKTAVDGITPKLSEKAPKTRLLMQFEEEVENNTIESSNKVDTVNSITNDPINEEDDEEEIGVHVRIKNKKRLQFSDDEDDGDVSHPSPSNQSESEAEDEEDDKSIVEPEPQPKAGLFFTKDGRLKRKFVEDEAELSGSDEGSDDEDERGLNHYEMEEGEDEEFDEVALENQVKRAHMKQLLDDDDRQILKLQNAYLENGDLHTDQQRERKFRWFNVNAIDDDAVMCNSDEEEKEETPEEVSQKLAWLEKRKWISENSHLLEPEDDSQSLLSNNRYLRLGKNTLKKIESFVDASTSDSNSMQIKVISNQRKSIYDEIIRAKVAEKRAVKSNSCSEGMNFSSVLPSEVKKSTSMSEPLTVDSDTVPALTQTISSTKKGSFLSRGGMMLAKMAEVNKTGDITSNVKTNSRNFVFSHVTPPNPDKANGTTSRVKRGSTGGLTSCKMQAKKLKIDRSFSNMDEASKGASIFKWL